MNVHLPFNRYFWLALVGMMFAGGMLYGRAVNLNRTLDEQAASVASSAVVTDEQVEMRHIDIELRMLIEEPLEDDFTEIDDALADL